MKMKNYLPVLLLFCCLPVFSQAAKNIENEKIISANRINDTTVELLLNDNRRIAVDFYGNNIFRVFQDNDGGIIRDPAATPPAQILVDNPRSKAKISDPQDDGSAISIHTEKITVKFDKATTLMNVRNNITGNVVLQELKPVQFEPGKVTVTLKENPNEYFYGGGVQNGRFSHKGRAIAIENQNSWTDGGVASPNPYYWSTEGYGVMWYTFKKGKYDFGFEEKGIVSLYHETDYLDVFYMVNDGAVALLNDFYQLTGNPVFFPKFAFYQGHLNAYNRDYWTEDENGILFEDGKRYKENQKDLGHGIKESLNGELNNYQFSARAVVDRYKAHDMPLGWVLPNDGYGAGYGQTETLDGNIQNLKSFADYALSHGVYTGLWTQSDLHPKEGISALLQRDIVKEVRDAGVRVLKTDVAWVGPGYSFGLNGIADAAQIMTYYGNEARPFIISLDGWAGTQRYAGIWSGDQTGGVWEYIRFHIPTYIGSGLSGNPNISSDMDGIFGGKNLIVNTRDFQWKTFTPAQLNMDGWGSNEKYPHALGEPATSINRWYLKWKSELMPYVYSIARESVDGLPMIRAMFLHYPNAYTLGKATQYQFLYGPYLLVAPIYQDTASDEEGNDIRNGIYLPEGTWIDYYTGELYEGNRILNNFDAPLWKLPMFVKSGAIIPLVNPNNNPHEIDETLRIYELYPSGISSFIEYDDNGLTEAYRCGESVTTKIESALSDKGKAIIVVHPAEGSYEGMERNKRTEFRVNVTSEPKKVTARIGRNNIKLTKVTSLDAFNNGSNVYYYEEQPNLNRFATPGSEFERVAIIKNPMLRVKLGATDITTYAVTLEVEGYVFNPANSLLAQSGSLTAPANGRVEEDDTEAYKLTPRWEAVANADYYEIDFNNMLYSTIKETSLLFEDLVPETDYTFKLRAVNKDGNSDWTAFSATTNSNPLEFAIQGIRGETSVRNQGGSGPNRLFDFDESNLWHTAWDTTAVPFTMTIDLVTVNQLDKLHYLPREDARNGTLLKGTIAYSMDKKEWSDAVPFTWERNGEEKVFTFDERPTARYIRFDITEAVGNFGSGREMYVFKVPGTESYLQGDINADGKIDENDFTSYMNYTGLRRGDADFDYVSIGDINRNGLIDAYDISVVSTQLEGGVRLRNLQPLQGAIEVSTAKQTYNKDEIIEVVIKGKGLSGVNALSFALPYNTRDYEYVDMEAMGMKEMTNMTYDRLHTNGTKALYPTFVNRGNKPVLEGDEELFVIKFKANNRIRFDLKPIDVVIADKQLNSL